MAAWTHRLENDSSSAQAWIVVALAVAVGFLGPFVIPGTVGVAAAFLEPFALVAAIVCIVTGQWAYVAPLVVLALVCDIVRRSTRQVMDARARQGIGDPDWPI